MANTYELTTEFSSRQSFGHKALVRIDDNQNKILMSYGTEVMEITSKKELKAIGPWDYSNATVSHVREFLKQDGFLLNGKDSKSDIQKLLK